VAYVDMNGSGIETVAHLQENGRVTMMFCAFDGPPKIVRLHGAGSVLRRASRASTPRSSPLPLPSQSAPESLRPGPWCGWTCTGSATRVGLLYR
jgi:hypothetical protein